MTESFRLLTPGAASGGAIVLDEPLSIWGGLDPKTGVIIDAHHPQRGASVTGRVVFMPHGKGSSSSSSVVLECARSRTHPVAFVLLEPDEIIALGAIAARELYGIAIPIAVVDEVQYGRVHDGDAVEVSERGVRVRRR